MTLAIPILDPHDALLALMNAPTPGRDWTLGTVVKMVDFSRRLPSAIDSV